MTRVVLYQIGRETADNLILVQLREKKHRQYTFTPQVIYELMKNTDDGKVRSMWESAKNVYFYVRHNNKPVTVTVAKQDCGFFVDATDNILKKRSPPNPPEMIRRKDELVAVVVP